MKKLLVALSVFTLAGIVHATPDILLKEFKIPDFWKSEKSMDSYLKIINEGKFDFVDKDDFGGKTNIQFILLDNLTPESDQQISKLYKALYDALKKKNINIVKLKNGTTTPLMYAASKLGYETAKTILVLIGGDKGLLNAQDYGDTALIKVARFIPSNDAEREAQGKIIKLLIDSGADQNIKSGAIFGIGGGTDGKTYAEILAENRGE